MDRGYVKYTRFAEWDPQGIFFVARLYANQMLKATETRETSGEANVLEDANVDVPTSDKGTRQLRRVTYRYTGRKGEEKKAIMLTHRWDLRAHEVAELYRRRWRIETFFNDFKNRMNGAHLHTSNPQGVHNQLLIAAHGVRVDGTRAKRGSPYANNWFIHSSIRPICRGKSMCVSGCFASEENKKQPRAIEESPARQAKKNTEGAEGATLDPAVYNRIALTQ